jgi:hypothetical protein
LTLQKLIDQEISLAAGWDYLAKAVPIRTTPYFLQINHLQ